MLADCVAGIYNILVEKGGKRLALHASAKRRYECAASDSAEAKAWLLAIQQASIPISVSSSFSQTTHLTLFPRSQAMLALHHADVRKQWKASTYMPLFSFSSCSVFYLASIEH